MSDDIKDDMDRVGGWFATQSNIGGEALEKFSCSPGCRKKDPFFTKTRIAETTTTGSVQ